MTTSTVHELFTTYVGSRSYAAALQARARDLRKDVARARLVAAGDEVSEEIVVWGESEPSGGGGVDVITLNPWMFEFHIDIDLPPITLSGPGNSPGGDDTPEVDPCAQLAGALSSAKSSLAANQTALKALDELITSAPTAAEKRRYREEKRKAKESISDIEKLIKDIEKEMHDSGC